MEKPAPPDSSQPPQPQADDHGVQLPGAPPTAEADQPVVEVTYPSLAEAPTISSPAHTSDRRPKSVAVGLALGAMLLLCVVVYGSFWVGVSRGRTAGDAVVQTAAAVTPLSVPNGAIMTNQCAVGRGTQYALPSDMTNGPVFNVYRGKVIGLEYTISKADLAGTKSFFGLPLYGKRYDHLDVGTFSDSAGESQQPTYHIDIFNISRAASEAITCTSS